MDPQSDTSGLTSASVYSCNLEQTVVSLTAKPPSKSGITPRQTRVLAQPSSTDSINRGPPLQRPWTGTLSLHFTISSPYSHFTNLNFAPTVPCLPILPAPRQTVHCLAQCLRLLTILRTLLLTARQSRLSSLAVQFNHGFNLSRATGLARV